MHDKQHAHWLRLTWPDPTGDRLGACVHACAVRAAQAASDRSCPPGTCLPRRQRPRARAQTGGRLASGGGRRGDCKGERLGGVNKQIGRPAPHMRDRFFDSSWKGEARDRGCLLPSPATCGDSERASSLHYSPDTARSWLRGQNMCSDCDGVTSVCYNCCSVVSCSLDQRFGSGG